MTKREMWKQSDDQINRKMDEDAEKKRNKLERLLAHATEAQHKFWDALTALEDATGLNWDDKDLQTWSVDYVLLEMEKAWRKKHPTQTVEPKKGQDNE